MSQEDLLRRAIEMRKNAIKKIEHPEPAPVIEEKVEVSEPVKEIEVKAKEETKSPQQQILDRAIEQKRKQREEEKTKPREEKKPEPAPEPQPVVEPEPAPKPKKNKVKPKQPVPNPEAQEKFTQSLNPTMRSFSPTITKLFKPEFGAVSVGADRMIVKNPVNVETAAQVERLAAALLQMHGVSLSKVEQVATSELSEDLVFRIYF